MWIRCSKPIEYVAGVWMSRTGRQALFEREAPDSLRFPRPHRRSGAAGSQRAAGGDSDDGSLFHGQAWIEAAVRSE
jgi:hypothetical protein